MLTGVTCAPRVRAQRSSAEGVAHARRTICHCIDSGSGGTFKAPALPPFFCSLYIKLQGPCCVVPLQAPLMPVSGEVAVADISWGTKPLCCQAFPALSCVTHCRCQSRLPAGCWQLTCLHAHVQCALFCANHQGSARSRRCVDWCCGLHIVERWSCGCNCQRGPSLVADSCPTAKDSQYVLCQVHAHPEQGFDRGLLRSA